MLSAEWIERVLGPAAARGRFPEPIPVVVHRAACRVRGRQIHGAWDPALRRVELFGVEQQSDAQMLRTLLHELAHAGGVASEAQAETAASEALAKLSGEESAQIVARLRRAAFDRAAIANENGGL